MTCWKRPSLSSSSSSRAMVRSRSARRGGRSWGVARRGGHPSTTRAPCLRPHHVSALCRLAFSHSRARSQRPSRGVPPSLLFLPSRFGRSGAASSSVGFSCRTPSSACAGSPVAPPLPFLARCRHGIGAKVPRIPPPRPRKPRSLALHHEAEDLQCAPILGQSRACVTTLSGRASTSCGSNPRKRCARVQIAASPHASRSRAPTRSPEVPQQQHAEVRRATARPGAETPASASIEPEDGGSVNRVPRRLGLPAVSRTAIAARPSPSHRTARISGSTGDPLRVLHGAPARAANPEKPIPSKGRARA